MSILVDEQLKIMWQIIKRHTKPNSPIKFDIDKHTITIDNSSYVIINIYMAHTTNHIYFMDSDESYFTLMGFLNLLEKYITNKMNIIAELYEVIQKYIKLLGLIVCISSNAMLRYGFADQNYFSLLPGNMIPIIRYHFDEKHAKKIIFIDFICNSNIVDDIHGLLKLQYVQSILSEYYL